MLVIAFLMQRAPRPLPAHKRGPASFARAGRTAAAGLGASGLAGFFGIGGGFLIVPGLIMAAAMPIIEAVGSSLAVRLAKERRLLHRAFAGVLVVVAFYLLCRSLPAVV